MTYKSNIASTARVQYVLLQGNDNDSGLSLETAKSTIAAATTALNNLTPPPSTNDPASLIVSAAGNFAESVTLSDGVSMDAQNISFGPLTGDVITAGILSNINVFQVGTTQDTTNCFVFNGVNTVSTDVKNVFVLGIGSVGFNISGNSSNINCNFDDLSLFGTSSIGILNTADVTAPLGFSGQDLLLRNTNCVGVQQTPTAADSELVLNVNYIGNSGPQTNTSAIVVNEGIISGVVGRIVATNAITVNGGVCNLISSSIEGIITVAVGAVLNCDVPEFSGTIVNNGTINGRLGTETYGDARIEGNLVIDGDLNVNGTLTAINTENLLVANNNILLNAGLIDTVLQTGGLVVNHGSSGTSDTVLAGAFVAGVNGVSNPTVTTVGINTFSADQFVQISGTLNEENDGIFEILSHAANVLTVKGVGLTDTVEFFSRRDFVANASDNANLINADIGVLRSDTTGGFEIAGGTSTPLTYISLGTGSGDVIGPGPTVEDNSLATFNGTGGLTIQNVDNYRVLDDGTNILTTIITPGGVGDNEFALTDALITPKCGFVYNATTNVSTTTTGNFVVTSNQNTGAESLALGASVSMVDNTDDLTTLFINPSATGINRLALLSNGSTDKVVLEYIETTDNSSISADGASLFHQPDLSTYGLVVGPQVTLSSDESGVVTNELAMLGGSNTINFVDAAGLDILFQMQAVSATSEVVFNCSGSQFFIQQIGGDTQPVLTLQSDGGGGADVVYRVGTTSPEGRVGGNRGDHFLVASPIDNVSTEYIKRTGADGTNTGWSANDGDVVGPSSSTLNALPYFGDTSGKLLDANNNITHDTAGNLNLMNFFSPSVSGSVDLRFVESDTILIMGRIQAIEGDSLNIVTQNEYPLNIESDGDLNLFNTDTIEDVVIKGQSRFTTNNDVAVHLDMIHPNATTPVGLRLIDSNTTTVGAHFIYSEDATNLEVFSNSNMDITAFSGEMQVGAIDIGFTSTTAGANFRYTSPSAQIQHFIQNSSPQGSLSGNPGDVAFVDSGGTGSAFFVNIGATTSNTNWANTVGHELLFGDGSIGTTTTDRFLTPGYDQGAAPTTAIGIRATKTGTLRRLFVRHNTPTGNGNFVAYTVRVNGVQSSLIVSMASTASDGQNVAATAAVTEGDLIDVLIEFAGGGVGNGNVNVTATMELA